VYDTRDYRVFAPQIAVAVGMYCYNMKSLRLFVSIGVYGFGCRFVASIFRGFFSFSSLSVHSLSQFLLYISLLPDVGKL
jgi:hypothetical protein